MSKLFGGSQTQTTEIPQYLQDASKSAINRAEGIANMGYVPYYGPDVAAATGQQIASWKGANQAASAFGMPTAAIDLPKSQTFKGGVEGYSSGGLYDQAVRELKAKKPGLAKEYQALISGGAGQAAAPAASNTQASTIFTRPVSAYDRMARGDGRN